MERAFILTPTVDEQQSRITQKHAYFWQSTITPVTFFMAHRLGEDKFVDSFQRSLQALLIQFHSQTDASMPKDILKEFHEPIKESWKPNVQCSMLKRGMRIMKEGKI